MRQLRHSYSVILNSFSPSRLILKGEKPKSSPTETNASPNVRDLLSDLKNNLERNIEEGVQRSVNYVKENVASATKTVEKTLDGDRRRRKPALDTIFNQGDIQKGVASIQRYFGNMTDAQKNDFAKKVAELPPIERGSYIAVTLGPNVTGFGMEYNTRFVQSFLGVADDNLFFGESTRALLRYAKKVEKIEKECTTWNRF